MKTVFKNKAARTRAAEKLPSGDPSAIYSGLDSKELALDQAEGTNLAQKIVDDYKENFDDLSKNEMLEAVEQFEQLKITLDRVYGYIQILETRSTSYLPQTAAVKKWYDDTLEKVDFFESGLRVMAEKDAYMKLGSTVYAPWLTYQRIGVGEDVEEDATVNISTDYANFNTEALQRLYHEVMTGIMVKTADGARPLHAVADDVSSRSTPPEKKKAYRQAVADEMEKHAEFIAMLYNSIIKDALIDTKFFGQGRPDESTVTANGLDIETIDMMHEQVEPAYARLAHRFNTWRANAHGGKDTIPRYYTTVPVPGTAVREGGYSFAEACGFVQKAFHNLSPRFGRIVGRFFRENRVDAEPRKDKDGGGWCFPCGKGNLPYISINYNGTAEDVIESLGHESGHGLHFYLLQKKQPFLLTDVSTPIAETASMFAEKLVFDEMIRAEKDPAVKRGLLVSKIDGMLQGGMQQLSYDKFEKTVYEERQQGEIPAARFSEIWLECQKEYFGPSVRMDKYDHHYWMHIPHFFGTPFYVSSYSMAEQLVDGLYQIYKKAESKGPKQVAEFVENYTALLEGGLTENVYTAFRRFDMDVKEPAFWEQGLALVERYMDELEAMDAPAKAAKAAPVKKLPALKSRPK